MGFSHQRGAAARTILRARATGDFAAIEDAEEAVGGYLGDDLEGYIREHFPKGLAGLKVSHLDPKPFFDKADNDYYRSPFPGTVFSPRVGFIQEREQYDVFLEREAQRREAYEELLVIDELLEGQLSPEGCRRLSAEKMNP